MDGRPPRTLVSFRGLAARSWVNRAGATTEVLGFEDSAALIGGVAPWRLSVAALEHPAEFSLLPGLDRTFTVVGSRVRLSVGGHLRTVEDGEQLCFAGEEEVEITDLEAPCHAVNLMSRREAALPQVRARTLQPGDPGPWRDKGPSAAAASFGEPFAWVNLVSGLRLFDLLEGPLGAGRALGLFGPA